MNCSGTKISARPTSAADIARSKSVALDSAYERQKTDDGRRRRRTHAISADLGRYHHPARTRDGRGARGSGGLPLGPSSTTKTRDFKGFYDGHKDTFLVTDVSNKAQAAALHINFSREIGKVKGAPAQYFIRGKAARGQLSVFGSEPGEADYNPLWEEFFVTWKPGVKQVLLVKDDQIKSLAKSKKLTLKDAHVVLNAPITKVTK